MTKPNSIVVIGGGFYGCYLALFLAQSNLKPILIEAEHDIMLRASYANQARVHGGYHYPRNFITAWRSLVNFPRFALDFHEAVDSSFEKVYAIARERSKVNAAQFKQFCRNIHAPIREVPQRIRQQFNHQLIEDMFLVEEFAFDADKLREVTWAKLNRAEIPVRLNTTVQAVEPHAKGGLIVQLQQNDALDTRYVFNCTYAGINTVLQNSGLPPLPFKYEITEIALIDPPDEIKEIGITVMDGPFFSTMPFPARGLHSLSHVTYTPHRAWNSREVSGDPYQLLAQQPPRSNYIYMIKDAQRYLPVLTQAQYAGSLFEVKTVLLNNERDDGRPILLNRDYGFEGLYNIMGAKIDNIYDMFEFLKRVVASLPSPL